jgi:hypothetical protein
LVHEPGQVLGDVPRKLAVSPDDPVPGHGDDALEGLRHAQRDVNNPAGSKHRADLDGLTPAESLG